MNDPAKQKIPDAVMQQYHMDVGAHAQFFDGQSLRTKTSIRASSFGHSIKRIMPRSSKFSSSSSLCGISHVQLALIRTLTVMQAIFCM